MTHPRHPGAEVARRVREEIAGQRLDWTDVAVAADLSERQLRRRLHHETEFSVSEIARVATALGIPVGDLFVDRQESQ